MDKVILVLLGFLVANSAMAADVDTVFREELARREWTSEPLGDDRFRLLTSAGPREIYLGNIRRTYDRDQDPEAVANFLDDVVSAFAVELPGWADAAPHLFPMLESAAVDVGKDTVVRAQSDNTIVVLGHHVPGSGSVRLIRHADVAAWGTSTDEVWTRAQQELDKRAAAVEVKVMDAGGLRLVVLEAQEPYKASLLLSSALRSRVEKELGWPVLAVAPARDFVYLLARSSYDELGRVGAVVQREFREAAHPVSTEVWELSDAGMEAIGEFPVE